MCVCIIYIHLNETPHKNKELMKKTHEPQGLWVCMRSIIIIKFKKGVGR